MRISTVKSFGYAAREVRRQLLREPRDLLRVGAGLDRQEDVQPLSSGRLHEGPEIERVQSLLHLQRGVHGVDHLARVRVEVEADPVGPVEILDPAVPGVHGDAAEIRERELRFELPAHHGVRDAAAVFHGDGRRVLRHPGGLLLLVKALAAHPVRTALQGEGAIVDVRLQARKDALIEGDEIRLRVPLLGPEDLVGVRDGDGERCVRGR